MTKKLVLFTLAVLLGGVAASPLTALTVPSPPPSTVPIPAFTQNSGGLTVTNFIDNESAKFGCAFREVQAGVASPTSNWRTIRISNDAWTTADLNISTVIMTGDVSHFQLDTTSLNFAGIQPGTYSDLRVQYVPALVGLSNATIEITYQTDPLNNPTQYTTFRINLSGSAVAAPTTHLVFRHGQSNGPELWHGQTDIGSRAFDPRVVNAGTSAGVDIWIEHEGTGTITVNPAPLPANSGFVLDTSSFSNSLFTGQSTFVTVYFDPQSAVTYNEVISFIHNDSTLVSAFEVAVTGQGLDRPTALRVTNQPGPYYASVGGPGGMPPVYTGTHIDNNSTPSDFGNVAIGASKSITFVIAHGGQGVLYWAGYVPTADLTVSTPVSGSPEFTVNSTGFVGVLGEATYASFTVTFSPTTASGVNGSVTFTHDDGSEITPYTLNLTGNSGAGNTGGASGGSGCASVQTGEGTALLGLLSLLLAATLFRRRSVNSNSRRLV
ncbi:choice-of-anchor D domain-containing protein [Planctomycetota bacterium]|nr:choice-of-anchor D domain-containing protein [Planctomycetota bacterium]